MKYFTLIFLFFISFASTAQTVEIPNEMVFAGMRLKLTEPVKRELKADVDLITKNPKYFQVKVERANIYFPMMEKIFREAGFPEDFKYLAIQESSLISDAVSTSNAVGYWQFKKETAQEVGLRVDHLVDERKNIAASTRGAAAYLRKNNFFLDNWVYALLSYNLGLGGVKSFVKDKNKGASHMVIDDDMHWYVIRFLAHKLAYENAVGKNSPAIRLLEEKTNAGKTISELAHEKNIDHETLKFYNKWLLVNNAPGDRDYSFILPVDTGRLGVFIVQEPEVKEVKIKEVHHEVKIKNEQQTKVKVKNYQDITSAKSEIEKLGNDVPMFVRINKIRAIQAAKGDDISKLTLRAGINQEEFLQFNDLKSFDQITPGYFYYLQPKKNKALVLHHTVQKGEDIAMISQKYGIRQSAIRKRNVMDKREALQPGRILWLRMKRPKNSPIEMASLPEEKIIQPETIVKDQNDGFKNDTVPVKKPIKYQADSASKETTVVSLSESGKVHYVKAGETLYSISRIYSVSPDSLKKWNYLSGNSLNVGQQLIVGPSKKADIIHTVVQGETMYKIAGMYGVSVSDIKLWNGINDESLEIGKVLIIKRK
jgi:membrane-bound lytic murein transglycosylase D